MKERLKAIRTTFTDANGKKFTQTTFANEMHISRDMLASYEVGRVIPTDLYIDTLCEKFGINEEWLRTGKGEMFAPKTREKEIADLAKQLLYAEDDDYRTSLIELIAGMPADMIEYLKNWTLDYAEKIKEKELP